MTNHFLILTKTKCTSLVPLFSTILKFRVFRLRVGSFERKLKNESTNNELWSIRKENGMKRKEGIDIE